jgi:hypothetical protein
MDELEKFIRENREHFDGEAPPAGLWEGIANGLDATKTTKGKSIWLNPGYPLRQIAAAVTLLLVAGIAWILWPNQSASPSPVLAEIEEAEQYYAQMIAEKKHQLSQYDLKGLGIEDEFQQVLMPLDSAYQYMRTDLMLSQGNDRIIHAMIENLQLRLQILNQQLEILQAIQQDRDETNRQIQL